MQNSASLNAQIASDLKLNPLAIEFAAISNRCDFSCDFYANFQRVQRRFGRDFAERSAISNRAILLRLEIAAIDTRSESSRDFGRRIALCKC